MKYFVKKVYIIITYVDLGEGGVGEGVLAVVVGEGDGDPPGPLSGGELWSSTGILLHKIIKQIIIE